MTIRTQDGWELADEGRFVEPAEWLEHGVGAKSYSAQFATAVRAITDAYGSAGLDVVNDLRTDAYARLYVTDPATGDSSKVDLVVDDFRTQQPIQMKIGPVTHIDDAIGAKVGALWSRAEARDLIDVDAALRSGRYTREDLLRFAASHDPGFDLEMFAGMLRRAETLPDARFADYGVTGANLVDMRARFAGWRAELLDA